MVGAPEKAVKGLAGVPMVASWLKARSSLLVIMPISSEVSCESCWTRSLISCASEHGRNLSHISATNTSMDQHCIWFETKNAHRRIGLLKKAHIAKWLRSSWIERSPLPKKALCVRNESCQTLVSTYQFPSCPCHCGQRSRWHPSEPRLFWRYSWCTTRSG